MNKVNLKDLVKDNYCNFSHYQGENLFYNVSAYPDSDATEYISNYQFPIPIIETGNAFFMAREKAIYFMRWIRKAIENEELRLVSHSKIPKDVGQSTTI